MTLLCQGCGGLSAQSGGNFRLLGVVIDYCGEVYFYFENLSADSEYIVDRLYFCS